MVLVTGASGFLGQHLVRHLSAQGVPTRAMYHTHVPDNILMALPHIEWMQCDLLDIYAIEEAMQGVSDVYHCAAIVTFEPNMRDELLHFNPESTANIVNQALEQGIRKMVYVSSIAAIGRTRDEQKEITEDEEWGESRYNSAYAISKYLAETEVWRGIGEGLNAVMVNPGIILGATTGRDLSSQLMKMANKEFPFYSSGINSFVDADDVVKIMVALMGNDIAGERFIVSCGNYSYREVFTMMAKALNKRPPRYAATPLMTGIAWRLSALRKMLTGKKSLITKETASNANMHCYYNNSKLLNAMPGFSYTPISETINNMARSFIRQS